jgi:hypothetical protein
METCRSKAAVLYDKLEGGRGMPEKLFEKIGETLDLCRRMIRGCDERTVVPPVFRRFRRVSTTRTGTVSRRVQCGARVCTLSYLDVLLDA